MTSIYSKFKNLESSFIVCCIWVRNYASLSNKLTNETVTIVKVIVTVMVMVILKVIVIVGVAVTIPVVVTGIAAVRPL